MLYGAYGSNLNKIQMSKRCPKSLPYKSIIIKNWSLVFKGVADIEKKNNASIFLGLYKITADCEKLLDTYEEYPRVYNKAYVYRIIEDKKEKIMFYTMNNKFGYSVPTSKYFNVIERGYNDWKFNTKNLYLAAIHSVKNNSTGGYKSKNWKDTKYFNLNNNSN